MPVDFAGFNLVQDAVDGQFVTVILVDGMVDFGLAGEQRFDLGAFFKLRGCEKSAATDMSLV